MECLTVIKESRVSSHQDWVRVNRCAVNTSMGTLVGYYVVYPFERLHSLSVSRSALQDQYDMISHISVTPGICTPDGKHVK
jgi:hypothetical protein